MNGARAREGSDPSRLQPTLPTLNTLFGDFESGEARHCLASVVKCSNGERFNIPFTVAMHYVEIVVFVGVNLDASVNRELCHSHYLSFLYTYIIPHFPEFVNTFFEKVEKILAPAPGHAELAYANSSISPV